MKSLFVSGIILSLIVWNGGASISGVQVSEKTIAAIALIDKDTELLREHFKQSFNSIARRIIALRLKGMPDPGKTPSQWLTFWGSEHSIINETTNLHYMTARQYVRHVIQPYADALDVAFAKQLACDKNRPEKAWQWFSGHFDQYGITLPIRDFKVRLCEDERIFYAHGCAVGVPRRGTSPGSPGSNGKNSPAGPSSPVIYVGRLQRRAVPIRAGSSSSSVGCVGFLSTR